MDRLRLSPPPPPPPTSLTISSNNDNGQYCQTPNYIELDFSRLTIVNKTEELSSRNENNNVDLNTANIDVGGIDVDVDVDNDFDNDRSKTIDKKEKIDSSNKIIIESPFNKDQPQRPIPPSRQSHKFFKPINRFGNDPSKLTSMNSINHHLHHHLDIHNQSKIAANRVIETKLSKTNSNSHHLNDHRESPPSSASSSPSWTLKSNQYQRNGAQSTPTWSSMAPVSEDPMDFIKFLCRL